MDRRLSTLQHNILAFLAESYAHEHWGVRWRPGAGQPGWSPVDRTDVSRALARLERRGLVLRQNQRQSRCSAFEPDRPGYGSTRKCAADPLWGRTTHILLLPAGRAIIDELAADAAAHA